FNLYNSTAGARYWGLLSTGTSNGEGTGKLVVGTGTAPPHNSTHGMTFDPGGKLGIGPTEPGVSLSFSGLLGDKISLWGQLGNNFGFGIQGSLLQMHTDDNSSDIAFGYGSSSAFTETMRIKGNGNVGIGTTTPGAKLHVAGGGVMLDGANT